jgi:hypothetical protein
MVNRACEIPRGGGYSPETLAMQLREIAEAYTS